MLEDLADWLAGGEHEAADSVAPEMPLLNEVAQSPYGEGYIVWVI